MDSKEFKSKEIISYSKTETLTQQISNCFSQWGEKINTL